MPNDVVTLSVPARSEFARTVRMTASALMSRSDLTYDEVDEVKMAAEEAFVYAVDALGEDGIVTVTFSVDQDSIEMSVCLGESVGADDEDAEDRAELATFILEAVCDRYEFSSDEHGTRTLTLYKRAGGVDAD